MLLPELIPERSVFFEKANGDTIFFDEIGEIDLQTQVKLLRFLETKGREYGCYLSRCSNGMRNE